MQLGGAAITGLLREVLLLLLLLLLLALWSLAFFGLFSDICIDFIRNKCNMVRGISSYRNRGNICARCSALNLDFDFMVDGKTCTVGDKKLKITVLQSVGYFYYVLDFCETSFIIMYSCTQVNVYNLFSSLIIKKW